MSTNRILGARGEEIACGYLTEKGYRIIARNWRFKGGEIDIIATHRGVVVFIEVKTRMHSAYGYPEEAVTAVKAQHLVRGVAWYDAKHGIAGPHRIDVIAIVLQEGDADIRHIEDAVGGGS